MSQQGCANRVKSKGTILYLRQRNNTGASVTIGGVTTANGAFFPAVRIGGVTAINGISLKRSGVVDATELDPQPDDPPDGVSVETYFYTAKCPGTKEVDPLQVDLNMSYDMYTLLLTLYNDDEANFQVYILFRSGKVLLLADAYVEAIEMNVAENELVKTPVTFMPTNTVLFLANVGALPA